MSSTSSRSTPTSGSWRRHVRPRRHRRRLRRTRRPVPRRRSGRPRAHVVGHRSWLRRVQPARTPRDYARLGQHRPPSRSSVRARRHDRLHPAAWDDSPDTKIYIEAVHRLSELGAVVTHAAHGTRRRASTPSGGMSTSDGRRRLISRCELFDEADLDAALARFDELSRPAPRLENAASQAYERFMAYFAARDWDAHGRDDGRRHFQRRSPSSGERRGPTRSRCRDRKTCGRSPTSGSRT